MSWPAGLCSATSVCWLFGAPESACVDMEPDAWSGPQDTPSPYSIQLTYDKDSHNFNVRVAGDEFRSVLLQARRPGSTEPVGTFLPPSQFSGLKLLTCSAPGDSVTNRWPSMKTEVDVTWEPPSQTNLGSIYFVATVVKTCGNYWVDVQSQSVADLTRDIFWPGTVPDGYLWSTATASYQYSRDVEMSDELGLNSYRFSISWTRILPDGTVAGGINQDGIDYYNNLINELLINGMTPYISLYHWDGPQALQDQYGGWVSETMVDFFNDYARVCFQAFGDRVKHWVTFNEPWSFVVGGYGIAGGAPGIWDANYTVQYKAAHNVIRAHARAWHTYDEEFRADQQGSCGIVIGSLWSEPLDPDNPQDVLGAHLYQQFFMGWFGNPIFGNGNYPQEMIDVIAANSQQEDQYGGWVSETMVDFFNDYARVCFQAFGDRVKHWVTFNEPWSFVVGGYGIAGGAPGIWDANYTVQYQAAHNVIRAHARAWHTYDEEFRADQQGSCGIVIGSLWSEPLDPDNPQDVLGSHLYQQFFMGWYANPIFGNGNYPQEMIDIIAANSQQEGWPESRLPVFTEEEILYNRGTADFVGLNQYSARLIYASNDTSPVDQNGWFNWMSIMIPDLRGYKETVDPSWPQGEMIFLLVTPWCVRRQLEFFRGMYQYDGPFYLTETGISEAESDQPDLNDIWRTCYYTLYTNEVVKAVELDGVDHRGFFAWTLMDNVEWGSETHERFGLFYTNFSDPARTRTAKNSVATYRDIATTNGFPAGAPHTETARAIWDWCHTWEPYEGTKPPAATFNTGVRTADPTVDYFLPGVRAGAVYRDKVNNNNNNNNNL
uniref:Reelin domain-containing protein n=1 Tax=Branchiostoma floridae TaxID=7739 RepID=C3ZIT2_BRAFL|eukprot:XP_002591522.1 hypothetical protein BRAFLDRAFT_105205 [Branchiostoma floridae]